MTLFKHRRKLRDFEIFSFSFGKTLERTLVQGLGGMTFDNGASFAGGKVFVESATLTLGQPGSAQAGVMSGMATLFLTSGTLNAHGNFNLAGGTMTVVGGTINVDAGSALQVSGGFIDVGLGQLTINGTFTATSGIVQVDINSTTQAFGILTVNGDVNLSTQCAFWVADQAWDPLDPAGPPTGTGQTYDTLFTWTGTQTGTMTLTVPLGWVGKWNANGIWITDPTP